MRPGDVRTQWVDTQRVEKCINQLHSPSPWLNQIYVPSIRYRVKPGEEVLLESIRHTYKRFTKPGVDKHCTFCLADLYILTNKPKVDAMVHLAVVDNLFLYLC